MQSRATKMWLHHIRIHNEQLARSTLDAGNRRELVGRP